jgi:hypothetical protein
MYTLFIGGIILVVLTPLFNGTRRNVVDSHGKMSWDNTERIEQGIQQAKEKVSAWGFYSE